MEALPWHVPALFGFTVIVALSLFARATHFSKRILLVVAGWIILQSLLSLNGFYRDPAALTARFPLLVGPPLIGFASLFFTVKGRAFLDSMDLRSLTILHIIRVGVETVLVWLFMHKGIPQAMTIEGRNFDLFSGISAPVVYYFYFVRRSMGRRWLIAWNVLCICLLLSVVASAFLSLPARYSSFGFEQPNVAVGYFPFVLLPAILVPMVLFSHAAAIRQLVRQPSIISKS